MLKLVLVDIFPNIIDEKQIMNFIWKSIVKDDELQFLIENETYSHWLNEDLSIPEVAQKFLEDIKDVQDRAKKIIEEFKKHKSELIVEFFKTFKFDSSWNKFFDDAQETQCVVVLNNNNGEQTQKLVEMIKKPKGVYTNKEYGLNNIDTFLEELSSKNIAIQEFIYITSDEARIDTLEKKGCFCVRISSSGSAEDTETIRTISSIEDLDFGNLAFNFYDSEGSDDDGGL